MKKLFNWFLASGFVVNDDYSVELRASQGAMAVRVKKLYNGYWVIIRHVNKQGFCEVLEFNVKTSGEVISEIADEVASEGDEEN